jgi:hypothetical protein
MSGCLGVWLFGWLFGWMSGCLAGCLGVWLVVWLFGWMSGCLAGRLIEVYRFFDQKRRNLNVHRRKIPPIVQKF